MLVTTPICVGILMKVPSGLVGLDDHPLAVCRGRAFEPHSLMMPPVIHRRVEAGDVEYDAR
jgi:hypothetical protein